MTMRLNKVSHIAVICSNYERSLEFYTHVLGLTIIAENYRENRKSHKTDLALNGEYIIELFAFPEPPARPTRPEATGLRHLAFEVDNIQNSVAELENAGISHEEVRIDEYTGKRFVFFQDPDGLPIELYEK